MIKTTRAVRAKLREKEHNTVKQKVVSGKRDTCRNLRQDSFLNPRDTYIP
jgi:hypothetical protein